MGSKRNFVLCTILYSCIYGGQWRRKAFESGGGDNRLTRSAEFFFVVPLHILALKSTNSRFDQYSLVILVCNAVLLLTVLPVPSHL